jgi:hypothetical protein
MGSKARILFWALEIDLSAAHGEAQIEGAATATVKVAQRSRTDRLARAADIRAHRAGRRVRRAIRGAGIARTRRQLGGAQPLERRQRADDKHSGLLATLQGFKRRNSISS